MTVAAKSIKVEKRRGSVKENRNINKIEGRTK